MAIRPHISIHFEFGISFGSQASKSAPVVAAPASDLEDRPPPPPRKDARYLQASSCHHHHRQSQPLPQIQTGTQQHPRPQRPHVQLAIPNSSSRLSSHPNSTRSHHHSQQQHPRRRRHQSSRGTSYYQNQLDTRATRGRSAPPSLNDTYPNDPWTVAPHAPHSTLPRQEPNVPPTGDIPQMHFRLGDAEMPWTPRPEFGEDEADNDSDVDEAFFASRRTISSRGNGRNDGDMRLISRHSAPMVLSADSLAPDSDREPPPRHLSALQDALMTVDSGFGFVDTHQDQSRTSFALDLANVSSTSFSQGFATSLAMWNQDHRVTMNTSRERTLAQQSSPPQPEPEQGWSPAHSVGWAVAGSSSDNASPQATFGGPLGLGTSAGCQLGLVSPVSSIGGFFPSRNSSRYSADTSISAA